MLILVPSCAVAVSYTHLLVLLILLAMCIAGVVLLLGRQPALNAVVIILAFGFFMCVLNPINDSPDEGAHYIRAETVAQGRLFTSALTPVEVDQNINARCV